MSETTHTRPHFPSRAVVTAGMPYGNKNLHFGHIGGVFVPADFYARFLRDRIGKENVLFVSGTDCYGSPIQEGYRKAQDTQDFSGDIYDYVEHNHEMQKHALDSYQISLDIFSGSALDNAREIHAQLSQDILQRLYEQGVLTKRSTLQFYDTEAKMFLNGRQVIGRCPVKGCKSEKAYADECDMGHQFDPEELIAPVSQITGTTPELRPAENWYFDLPAYKEFLENQLDAWDRENVRSVVGKTVAESLSAPIIYIRLDVREAFNAMKDELPAHTIHEAQGNQGSFGVEFQDWQQRDRAREILEAHHIRFRTGKTLLPLRLTGNADWGVIAPRLGDDTQDATIWVWPESLWAPISFTQAALKNDTDNAYATHDWKDWWADENARVYQFIGQDNIYFYCAAQPALWEALDWNLQQTIPVAGYHVLFMNKKASSSGAIKPPMAEELLDFYTPEQLRCHWLSLALDNKATSFSPKPFDTSVSHKDKKTGQDVLVKDDPRVADPALKEGTFLTNIFNRLARSCFYGAEKWCECRIPACKTSDDVLHSVNEALLSYEDQMAQFNFHEALHIAEEVAREANKRFSQASKHAEEDPQLYAQALVDALYALKATTLMMHPATPKGCELIAQHFNIEKDIFFSWDHAFDDLCELVGDTHELVSIPPRFDFFRKHESQYK